jgi:hypothetical protein
MGGRKRVMHAWDDGKVAVRGERKGKRTRKVHKKKKSVEQTMGCRARCKV